VIYRALRPLLFALDAETAHGLALSALKLGLTPRAPRAPAVLRKRLLGLDFPNPVGLAAGFDKHGEVPDAALRLGFGFVEIGSVTPRPQAGNPRPRVFRASADGAIVNRMGFNSEGHEAVYRRLAARERNGIVAVNLGANRDSDDRSADYVAGVRRFAGVASYLTVNISSPNTSGLRDLQEKEALTRLLSMVAGARAQATPHPPILLKIAPDLDDDALQRIAETAIGLGIEGVIATNTTLARDGIGDAKIAAEAGGVSGRPLLAPSTRILRRLREIAGNRLVLVGVGGVDSPQAAEAKFAAGADLVQLYTGMVYEGPGLPARIVRAMADAREMGTPGRSSPSAATTA
jgi:dihydroorotate dehydrogenase